MARHLEDRAQAAARVARIFDDQLRAPGRAPGRVFGCTGFLRPPDRRQPYGELGALARALARHAYAPAMHLDDALHEREADAQAALGALDVLVPLEEQLEHA